MKNALTKYVQQFKQLQRDGLKPANYNPIENTATTCRNCGHIYSGRFCPNCGQKAKTHRLTVSSTILDFVVDIAQLDNSVFRTLLELAIRPGYMMYDYVVLMKRKPYTKPVALLFVLATVYLVLRNILFGHIETAETIIEAANENKDVPFVTNAIKFLVHLLYDNKAVCSMIMMTALVLPNKLLFRKNEVGKDLNIAEHFYMLIYVSCLTLMFSIVMLPYQYYFKGSFTDSLTGMDSILLTTWCYHQFYGTGWIRSLRKTILGLILAALQIVGIFCAVVVAYIALGRLFPTLFPWEVPMPIS